MSHFLLRLIEKKGGRSYSKYNVNAFSLDIQKQSIVVVENSPQSTVFV